MKKALLLSFVILCFLANNCYAQEVKLTLNSSLEKTLTLGEVHTYTFDAEADKLIFAVVMQDGIDLSITAYDPGGKKVGDFDSPNFQNGPEYISFKSTATGMYRLEVIGLEENQPTGHSGAYTIKLLRVEPIASTPEGRIDQLFISWDQKGSPGASVAVMKKGRVVFSKGYGEAQLEYGIPIEPKTIFHIASVSKQFTAFSITKLADDGLISLDDPIQKYLPELHDFGKAITIRHLIHHTSGLRDQWNLLAMAGWRLDDVITRDQVIRLLNRQRELNFDPGAEFLYCNSGYTLMAEIVEQVTGKTFAEWTEENIFKPLGMTNTLFYDDHEKIVPNRAYSYGEGGNGFEKRVLSYANVGATSLFTTPEDLLKWAHNFSDPKVGNNKIIEQMHERGILTTGDTIAYAFGQGIGKWKGLKTVSHGGADAGYRTSLLRFPEQEVNIVVFSNLGSFNPTGKAYEIAEIYLKEYIEDQLADTEEAEKDVQEKKEEAGSVEVNSEIYNEYKGQYEIAPGFILTITTQDAKLYGQATGQTRFELEPKSEVEYVVESIGARLVFNRAENKSISHLTLYQGGQEVVCKRLPEFDPKAVDLTEFEGNFYSEELMTTYMLRVEDGKLVAKHQRHDDIELRPIQEDKFSANIWFFQQIGFVRDSDAITGMEVSNGRVRNLVFNKQ